MLLFLFLEDDKHSCVKQSDHLGEDMVQAEVLLEQQVTQIQVEEYPPVPPVTHTQVPVRHQLTHLSIFSPGLEVVPGRELSNYPDEDVLAFRDKGRQVIPGLWEKLSCLSYGVVIRLSLVSLPDETIFLVY